MLHVHISLTFKLYSRENTQHNGLCSLLFSRINNCERQSYSPQYPFLSTLITSWSHTKTKNSNRESYQRSLVTVSFIYLHWWCQVDRLEPSVVYQVRGHSERSPTGKFTNRVSGSKVYTVFSTQNHNSKQKMCKQKWMARHSNHSRVVFKGWSLDYTTALEKESARVKTSGRNFIELLKQKMLPIKKPS